MIRQDKENESHHDIYRKIKTIGSGNFGKACLVESKVNNQLYIIKKIKYNNDKNQYQSIMNQVNAMKKMKHPYVIAYKESYQQKSYICIVMEYAKGGDLHARVVQQKKLGMLFEQEQIWEWFIQLCLGLKCIHQHRIVHRDFKSQNIFLTDKQLCKIGDFGICKMMKQTFDLAQTKIGTPYCMAPQIWDGKAYNMKSDIWSLGCVLYQLCTLQHPFTADHSGLLYVKIRTGQPQKIISPKYSSQLRGLVAELLNKQPHKRPSVGTILEKDFIKRRKKNIFSKTMNISYQQSLQLSQKLNNRNKQTKQIPLLRPRSLSLPNICKVGNKKITKPKLKLSEYKQSYPIIEQQNKALKQELQQVQKQKQQMQTKFQDKINQINNLLEEEFTSVQELKEVIKEKLGFMW